MRLGRRLKGMGFRIYATEGTAAALDRAGVEARVVPKAGRGPRDTVAVIAGGEVQMIINTPLGQGTYEDQAAMREAAIRHKIPLLSTLSAAQAAVNGIDRLQRKSLGVRSLQRHHADFN